MLAPITQILNSLLEQIKQLSTTSTSSHNMSSHHKSHHNSTDRHKHKYHNRDTKHKKGMVIIREINHTVKIRTIEHITVDKTIGQGSVK